MRALLSPSFLRPSVRPQSRSTGPKLMDGPCCMVALSGLRWAPPAAAMEKEWTWTDQRPVIVDVVVLSHLPFADAMLFTSSTLRYRAKGNGVCRTRNRCPSAVSPLFDRASQYGNSGQENNNLTLSGCASRSPGRPTENRPFCNQRLQKKWSGRKTTFYFGYFHSI